MTWKQLDEFTIEKHPNFAKLMYLSRRYNITPTMMHYLFLYGIESEQELAKFIYPTVNNFHDPFMLNDLRQAITRVIRAIKKRENILIFGDYDCDGITSTTIMYKGIKKFGGNVQFRLPLRSEGYGLSQTTIDELHDSISLIITVDNGSSAHQAMTAAKKKGIDVIVTDHHEILGEHPDCHSFINPKRSDSTYPFDSLSGAGVAFKFIQALYIAANLPWEKHFTDYIELATLGTIADLMPLMNENRTICWFGIKKMNSCPSKVFKTLYKLLKVSTVDSSTLGFVVGPVFNSCGRIDDPNKAVEMILGPDEELEGKLRDLIQLNKLRQKITLDQFDKIDKKIIDNKWHEQRVIAVCDEFHEGIIGIIASRIAEKYKKPAIVITKQGVGSARSVNGTSFSIVNVIDRCKSYLIKYGGHQAAAGLSLSFDKYSFEELNRAIQEAATQEAFHEPIKTFLCTIPISEFPKELFYDLHLLEPFGMGFPKPIFLSPPITKFSAEQFGKESQHLKLQIKDKTVLAFSKGNLLPLVNSTLTEILYVPNNIGRMDFLLNDIRLCQNKLKEII
ncbi:single-stranded-DNA-specific exonuclease [Bacillus tianshenii]|uniref:Single-stranded-DNA-specific exonuclease RecJ n=1 Tax=Sutcliffiella tianshenii TaxID=1463404 RepID=A0ABS2NZV6_9BACI|nr:single-stranded-DNA-specific exonuclease RecJ [Bacillus tianshenii]MBM7620166.1 single-stranded-DNA-specific exonuclease [Bacillus tianshenii]